MVVFGHRRVRAAKLLERKVRAVVKEMKDREHVIAQGQENSARANLSFIEKALFAAKIARLNYDEDNATILTALAIDRATLSKMLSVAALPSEVLKAIGPAKGIGRDRWYELKLMLERSASLDRALSVIGDNEFSVLPSDDRFNALVSRVKAAKSSVGGHSRLSKRNWVPEDGSLAAEMTSDGKRFTLALKARGADAKAFGEYLSENLAQLYEAFREEKQQQGMEINPVKRKRPPKRSSGSPSLVWQLENPTSANHCQESRERLNAVSASGFLLPN